MVWPFSKKKKEVEELEEIPKLPELPPLPESIEFLPKEKFKSKISKPEIRNELPPLPAFPQSKIGEEISRNAVKEAVKFSSVPNFPQIKPRTREIGERKFPQIAREIKPEVKVEPIFVRIDKYQQASAYLQEIKRELLEIEEMLRNIREIKDREEAELERWEQEIQEAKEKLNNIDKTIFSKLEE